MALPPYALFVRNLGLSFLVFTAANGFFALTHAGAALGIWIVGLVLAVGSYGWAMRRSMSGARSGILSLFLWVLSLAYTGGLVYLMAPWRR